MADREPADKRVWSNDRDGRRAMIADLKRRSTEAGQGPDISVLVATWDGREALAECLAAVPAGCSPRSFETVVVVNGSRDGTAELLRERFPEARVIANDRNVGVARARNQALAAARGRVLVLLDDDAAPRPGSLATLAAALEERPDVGIAGPRLESPGGELQLSCRRFHDGLTPLLRRLSFLGFVRRSRRLRDYEFADWDHASRREVDQVIGACQAFRRETFERLGALDERMFYGWEDTDYCVRARLASLATLYVPEAVVVHRERRLTRARPLGRLAFEFLKSMLVFFAKHPGGLFGRYQPQQRTAQPQMHADTRR
jgi:N-acetylglucosaminyl-diphospho-decaprenol L-rhamnosyltransferase